MTCSLTRVKRNSTITPATTSSILSEILIPYFTDCDEALTMVGASFFLCTLLLKKSPDQPGCPSLWLYTGTSFVTSSMNKLFIKENVEETL
jgi:hypothetical protein